MPRRTLFVIVVDSAMLALVCVLECLDLTGLEIHEWLGFALCPLVLLHLTWQWTWFVGQFGKFLRAPGARARINALLNGLLLMLMSAVLLSGVLNSRQVISLVGERFGSVRVWREMHNWLNFTLFVLVALHLGLNWDWVLGVFKRPRRNRPALAEPIVPVNAPSRPQTRPRHSLAGRGLAALASIILSAGIAYFTMNALLAPSKPRLEQPGANQAASLGTPPQPPLMPGARPIALPHGFEQISAMTGFVFILALIGRYVFRLRL